MPTKLTAARTSCWTAAVRLMQPALAAAQLPAQSPRVCAAGASFVIILEALCDHVYQQAPPTAEPLPLQRSSVDQVASSDSTSRASGAAAEALAPESAGSGSTAPPAACTSSGGHGMVVDALGSLPSIHARRSVLVDSNGASFSVDDVAARRLRKEQRRKKAQEEAEASQSSALSASTADEKPNAPLAAAAQPWTDVPPEFCCALNGSLMRQPVLSPVCSLRLRCRFMCCRLTFRCRSNQNTGTPLIIPAS